MSLAILASIEGQGLRTDPALVVWLRCAGAGSAWISLKRLENQHHGPTNDPVPRHIYHDQRKAGIRGNAFQITQESQRTLCQPPYMYSLLLSSFVSAGEQ